MADALLRFPLNGNQDNTQKYTYKNKIALEINNTEEIPVGNVPINLKLIEQHQRKETILLAKYKYGKYQKGSFRGRSHTYINLITCEDKIFIP